MKKQSITISAPNDITKEEIKEIRKLFQDDELSKSYRLNILISGEEDMKSVLSDFLLERLRAKL